MTQINMLFFAALKLFTGDLIFFFSFLLQKYLIYAVLWSFSGDGRLKMRAELGEYIRRITTVPLPAAPNVPIIDYEVRFSASA